MATHATIPLATSISCDMEDESSVENWTEISNFETVKKSNRKEETFSSSSAEDEFTWMDEDDSLKIPRKLNKVSVYDDKIENEKENFGAKILSSEKLLLDSSKKPIDADLKKKHRPVTAMFHRAKNHGAMSFMSVLGDDSIYLVVLGVLMGIFSFAIDFCVVCLRKLQFNLFEMAGSINLTTQYATFVLYTMFLVLSAAIICQLLAPQAIGSGIPEMKTILRGVVLKEYLTVKTLIAKFLGLILVLGTGLPLGKEGPFVHIASMLARLLSLCAVSVKGVFENESRHTEMLAAACAVGVASTYGAPVGGVLFSIEVTSVFFPLRNYWRGFLATVCSAVTFRLLAVWSQEHETLVAFSATGFPSEYPFDPKELIIFATIGILCGFGGAAFIWLHRKYVTLFMQNPKIKKTLFKFPFVYPVIVVFILSSIKCPLGYGNYFAGGLSPRDALGHLFSNFSWLDEEAISTHNESKAILEYWADGRNIFTTLSLYALNMFWMTAIAITLPVPCGVFIPVFVCGAAFGRVIGETMAWIFPNGVRTDGFITKIVPGAYAIVGATAFSGAVTHALSTSVVMVEITGQILYILPTMLAVLLANAVCTKLQPSIYDSIIRIKKLPYIPAIPPVSSGIHKIYVRDIMVTDVKYITLETTYRELQDLLIKYPKLRAFPLVDQNSTLILLGSISQNQLMNAIEEKVGEKARKWEAHQRSRKINVALKPFDLNRAVLLNRLKEHTKNETTEKELENNRKISRFSVKRISSEDVLSSAILPEKNLERIGNRKLSSSYNNLNTPHSNEASNTTYSRFVSTLHAAGNYMNALPLKFRQSLRRTANQPLLMDLDMTQAERLEWENLHLKEQLNFDSIQIDPAPFQLVERTSLYRVHGLFWLLGLNRAYVTSLGRLVGVVALRELRLALERTTQFSFLSPSSKKSVPTKSAFFEEDQTNKSPLLPEITRDPAKLSRLHSINPSSCFVPSQTEILKLSKLLP